MARQATVETVVNVYSGKIIAGFATVFCATVLCAACPGAGMRLGYQLDVSRNKVPKMEALHRSGGLEESIEQNFRK